MSSTSKHVCVRTVSCLTCLHLKSQCFPFSIKYTINIKYITQFANTDKSALFMHQNNHFNYAN